MASRIHSDFTKAVPLPPFEKPGAEYLQCEGGWCWKATTLEGTPIERGSFSTRAAAKEDCRKYVQQMLEEQRSPRNAWFKMRIISGDKKGLYVSRDISGRLCIVPESEAGIFSGDQARTLEAECTKLGYGTELVEDKRVIE